MFTELFARTHYSFLRGASSPEEMIRQAEALGYSTIGITDRDGVYGLPKAYQEILELQDEGVLMKLIAGAELTLEDYPRVTLIPQNKQAYGLMCRMLTRSFQGREKGDAALRWKEFIRLAKEYSKAAQGVFVFPELSEELGEEYLKIDFLPKLKELFPGNVYLKVYRVLEGKDEERLSWIKNLGKLYDLPLVATNQVHYHTPQRRKLQDVLTAIREIKPVHQLGTTLFSNSERYLKSARQMEEIFSDLPEAIENTQKIAESCHFCMSELRYRYPTEWIPKGETNQSYLEKLVWNGAEERFPKGIDRKMHDLIEHELDLIRQLEFADYFLTIWEIVSYAKDKEILCQGRGSAANSVVCFCLGITAVDPQKIGLLFERFISVERKEPPDIDVDFEHERREEVLQYVYEKYGRDRAAMVCNMVKYRGKSAVREVSKALGMELSKAELRDEPIPAHLKKLIQELAEEIENTPRHLSIHSGGFTLSADPIIELVPVEPARMEGRTVIQWDKYDLDTLGLIKVDLLSLGMLSVIRKTLNRKGLKLYELPEPDPKTYAMIQKADTVGTFQIESRAQMNMLGRLHPKCFYDLVIEVAIVRPGPITGKMVHPYLKRRRNPNEPLEYENPSVPMETQQKLKSILGKTLGVPLFQEQVMRIAIELAGFTPGEADRLRRAIGAWRSSGSIQRVCAKLMEGLRASGIPEGFVFRMMDQVKGFAEYGFPESHAASFALLAYASCYLKCHFPAEFACDLVNSQPMGFYPVHSILNDIKRKGVKVLPIDPNESDYDCVVGEDGRSIRMGFRLVSGLSEKVAKKIEQERKKKRFVSLGDFITRTGVHQNHLQTLAMGDAFRCFGYKDQRDALWAVMEQVVLLQPSQAQTQLNLFSSVKTEHRSFAFKEMDFLEELVSDHKSYGYSHRAHPMQALRGPDYNLPDWTTARVKRLLHGEKVSVAGVVLNRQRPHTANGVMFATLEDETGLLDLTLHKRIQIKYGEIFLKQAFLVVSGVLQRDRNSVNLLVRHIRPIWREAKEKKSFESLKMFEGRNFR